MTSVNSVRYSNNEFMNDSRIEEKENVQELISMGSTNILSEVKTYKLSEFINRLNDALARIDDAKEAKFVVKEESQQTTIELLNCPQKFSQVYFELRKEIDDDFIGDFFNQLEDMEYSFAQQLREEYNLQEPSDEISLRSVTSENKRMTEIKLAKMNEFINSYNEQIRKISTGPIKLIYYDYDNHEIYFNLITNKETITNFFQISIKDFTDIKSFSKKLKNKLNEVVISLSQGVKKEEMNLDEIRNKSDSSSEEITKAEEPIRGFNKNYNYDSDSEQEDERLGEKFYLDGPLDQPLDEINGISNVEKVTEICKFINSCNNVIGQLSRGQMQFISYEYKNSEICFNLKTNLKLIPNFLRINIADFTDIGSFPQILENKLKEIAESLPQMPRVEERYSEPHSDYEVITGSSETTISSDGKNSLFLDEWGHLVENFDHDEVGDFDPNEIDWQSWESIDPDIIHYEVINSESIIVNPDDIDFTKPNIFCDFNLEYVVQEISFVLSSFELDIFGGNLSFGIVEKNLCFRFDENANFFWIPAGDVCSEISFRQLFSSAIQDRFGIEVEDLLAISF